MPSLSLRAKSVLALLLACLLALVPTVLAGWVVVEQVRDHLGEALARNLTALNVQKVTAPVAVEIAGARQLAGSVAVREWLAEEDNDARRAQVFAEAAGFRGEPANKLWFLVSEQSLRYYLRNAGDRAAGSYAYTLDRGDPKDSWYFGLTATQAPYIINVDIDKVQKRRMVWTNVVVRAGGGAAAAVIGSGLDLDAFLSTFIHQDQAGVLPMVVNGRGALQAHPDPRQIAYNSATQETAGEKSILALLAPEDAAPVRETLRAAAAAPQDAHLLRVRYEGRPRLMAVQHIPELQWFMVTLVDVHAASLLGSRWTAPLAAVMALMLALLLAGFAYATDRLVLRPLRRLEQSAQAMAAGDFDTPLEVDRRDEIGALSQAFARMRGQIRRHTQELEAKVMARTQALARANEDMAQARRQIDRSIEYASLIQRAILPDRRMAALPDLRYAILWKPRDRVGGDFYVFHASEGGYLIGLFDCAGHGVPGALMTMLARAEIEHAVNRLGHRDPAALLAEIDVRMRSLLSEDIAQSLATTMDAGLVWVDAAQRSLRFAGAKIALYTSDGREVREFAGGARPLGHKRAGSYRNTEVALEAGWTCYLSTDGFLDQAGGEQGFGFGRERFVAMLRAQAGLPLDRQTEAFLAAFDDYRGDQAQRDDIALLSFRPFA
ncbi:MAG: biofilm regulation protein phosphatase SiaA [Xylophilus ampelinus]